jgi:predicted GNAT family acetyltransferase
MGALKLTACMKVVAKMGEMDQDALLERLDRYSADGVPKERAQIMAASDTLAELEAERKEFMSLLRTQHPDLFVVSSVDSSVTDDPDMKFSLRRKPDPENTVQAYKLFRVDDRKPGTLFPLFVNANDPVPLGKWLDAEEGPVTDTGKVKSKLGQLAYRPGWHAGDLPIATHIGEKSRPSKNKPDVRPDNQVWAEVEFAADRDWQTEANKRGTNSKGKLVPVKAHITDQIPEDGFYRYKTNPNMTGNWLIGGSMKVLRVLSDDEVASINRRAGVSDLPRQKPFDADKYGFDIKRSTQRTPFTIETSSNGETATAKVGSRVVGKAHAWEDSRGKFVIMNTEVRDQYRRRGIASAMYKAIEDATGRELTPAVSLSDDAFELWKSYRPEAVPKDLRHWKDQLIGARVDFRGDTGRIVKASGGAATMEFDQPKDSGATQRTILRDDLNTALSAAGSRTIDFSQADIKRSTGRSNEVTIDLSEEKAKRKVAKEWVAKVSDMFPVNPMNPRQRVMMLDDENMAVFELDDSVTLPGAAEVVWFQAYPLRNGNGTKAMQELQRLAAEDDIPLTLYPWDKGRVSQASLIKFYKKNGFEMVRRGGKDMIWKPEGEIKRSTRRHVTETPEFKNWFGDSKVVAQDGQPIVVYTGTSKDVDFKAFKIPKNGAWFTDSTETASEYARHNDSQNMKYDHFTGRFSDVNTSSRVIPAYLRIEKPYVITEADRARMNVENYKRAQGQLFDELRAKGHDGVDMGKGVWVVIGKPTQIKSAIGNIGAFDPNDANITRSTQRAQTETPSFKRWFGDSKVVDESGRPLAVYHGSPADVSSFNSTVNWVSASADLANAYANAERAAGSTAAVYPLFVSARNPVSVGPVGNKMTVMQLAEKVGFALDIPLYAEGQHGVYRMINTPEFVAAAKAAGHDGVFGYEAGRKTWGVFDPTQIKSSIGNNGNFDPTDPDIRRSTQRSPLGFYSALAKGIEDIPTKQAPAGAWKSQIKGLVNKGAVKADEVEWSGINDWLDLQQGKVSKDQVAQYLEQGGVRVEEAVLGKPDDAAAALNRALQGTGYTAEADNIEGEIAYYDEEGDMLDYGDLPANVQRIVDEQSGKVQGNTKYGQYTLPGGENYREVLLTLPGVDAETQRLLDEERYLVLSPEDQAKVDAAKKRAGVQYRSRHWDQPNVLAHIRVNDRTDADGNKVLFVEELQSDWGQEGKKKGFRKILTDAQRKRVDELNSITEERDFTDAEQAEYDSMRDGFSDDSGVPAAPFVTKTEGWLNLALKRVMVMAAEGGYDKVAFVNGEQSADRYDLSKRVDWIIHYPVGDKYQVTVRADGKNAVDDQFSADQLDELVGKEVAQKIVNGEGEKSGDFGRKLSGLGLKVGGEGMKTFYDTIVPTALKRLLPKVGGGQVGEVQVGASTDTAGYDASNVWIMDERDSGLMAYRTRAEAERMLPSIQSMYPQKQLRIVESAPDTTMLTQPGFDVTNAMREKVEGGLTLFSKQRDQTETPEFKRWFGDSKVVDESGRPMVMYHGTERAEFDVFNRLKSTEWRQPSMDTVGSWFSNNPSQKDGAGLYGSTLMPVYLSIKNPKKYRMFNDFLRDMHRAAGRPMPENAPGRGSTEELRAELKSQGYDGIEFEQTDNGSLMQDIRDMQDSVERAKQEEFSVPRRDRMPYTQKRERLEQTLKSMRKELGEFGSSTEFDGQRVFIAFEPEQIKSAIGNNGQFDPNNPDIRRSTGRTSTGAAWDSPSVEKFDDLVYKLQDKQIDTKRVVDAIKTASGAIADDLNVYLQEELYHGRTAKRTEDFVNMELNPLVEQLAKDGLKLEDLEEYLHARHAEEANKVIAARNPGVAGLQDGGSGMMTADAKQYLATLPADLQRKLSAAAAKVDAILGKTRQLYVDYELESKDTVDAWGKMFQHYIPLQREDKDGGPGIGQGFSVKGRETKGRTGSTRKVVDILANIALQRERAIVRGEKNRVSQALVGLAEANPNDGFWKVDIVPTERVFNEKTGLVEDRVDPLYKSRENALIAKIADASGRVREHAVLFNEEDQRAMRMAAALKNLDAAKLEGLMGVSASISRYFAAVNTQYNPVFGVVNLVRDVQGAILNLGTTPIADDRSKVAKYTLSALRGIYGDARAARKGQSPSSQWAALWDEFQEVGGQTGYRELFRTSADRADAIKKVLDPDAWADSRLGKIFTVNGTLKVPMAAARRVAGWIFDWLSDYNLAMENGVRLAAYKAALERGLSKEQAASVAKNLTVNFNRKGQIGQQAGALYAFFNASVQGTARIGQTLFDMEPGKPKTLRLSSFGKKVVGGGMMLGSIQALMLAAAGYNDEDPPEFVRERSLIIPLPGGKYMTIPMPLGFHVIPNIGRHATEFALSGFKDPHKRAVTMAAMFADTFNPIGNAGLSMQTLAPTALDPLVALTENRDYTGKPIARESSNKAMPGHALSRDTATSLAKFLSEGINTLSGGNKYVAGVFSPTPDQIDYLIGQVTGGVGRELSKVEQTGLSLARGEALPTYKVPLAGRFFGDTKQQASEGSQFYANTERLNRLETEIKGLQKDGKMAEAAELRRSSSEAYLITQANVAERQIQRLRNQKRELVKEGAPREQVRAIEEQITQVMARLNRAVESLREKQEN